MRSVCRQKQFGRSCRILSPIDSFRFVSLHILRGAQLPGMSSRDSCWAQTAQRQIRLTPTTRKLDRLRMRETMYRNAGQLVLKTILRSYSFFHNRGASVLLGFPAL
jgi:hypothetical protein